MICSLYLTISEVYPLAFTPSRSAQLSLSLSLAFCKKTQNKTKKKQTKQTNATGLSKLQEHNIADLKLWNFISFDYLFLCTFLSCIVVEPQPASCQTPKWSKTTSRYICTVNLAVQPSLATEMHSLPLTSVHYHLTLTCANDQYTHQSL